jgi:glycosyltransferase involved in cell wall biosynthesis
MMSSPIEHSSQSVCGISHGYDVHASAHSHSRVRRAGKVLLLGRDLVGGGVEKFLCRMAGILSAAGYEPVLALFNETAVPAECLPLRRYDLKKRRPWDNVRAIARLARIIDHEAPDILFAVDTPLVWRASEALRFCRHSPYVIARVANNPCICETGWRAMWAKRAYRSTDLFIANSKGLAIGFTTLYPTVSSRIRVCYDPTDFQRIRYLACEPTGDERQPGFMLTAVGRICSQKRYDVLVDAMAEVVRQADVRLTICGDGPDRANIEARAAALRLGDRVRLLGHVENPYPWMAAADAVVLTSDYEGLPNVLAEAQCLGRPIVATNCPYGVDEVVEDGRTGFLAEAGDVAGVAAGILRLVANPELALALGREGQARAENQFSLEAASGAYFELFDAALRRVTDTAGGLTKQ